MAKYLFSVVFVWCKNTTNVCVERGTRSTKHLTMVLQYQPIWRAVGGMKNRNLFCLRYLGWQTSGLEVFSSGGRLLVVGSLWVSSVRVGWGGGLSWGMWWGEGGDGGKKGRLEAKARGWSILEVVPPARGSGCRPSSAHKPPLHSPTHNSSAHILHQLITTAAPSHPYSQKPPELHHFEFLQIATATTIWPAFPNQTAVRGLLVFFLLLRHDFSLLLCNKAFYFYQTISFGLECILLGAVERLFGWSWVSFNSNTTVWWGVAGNQRHQLRFEYSPYLHPPTRTIVYTAAHHLPPVGTSKGGRRRFAPPRGRVDDPDPRF